MTEKKIQQSQNGNREQFPKRRKPKGVSHDHWCSLSVHRILEGQLQATEYSQRECMPAFSSHLYMLFYVTFTTT